MAYEAISLAGSTKNVLKNALFMMWKSYKSPTFRGQCSLKERVIDSGYSFASQLIVGLYKDHGERVGHSANGIRGGLERLYDREENITVRKYFKSYINKFR